MLPLSSSRTLTLLYLVPTSFQGPGHTHTHNQYPSLDDVISNEKDPEWLLNAGTEALIIYLIRQNVNQRGRLRVLNLVVTQHHSPRMLWWVNCKFTWTGGFQGASPLSWQDS